MGDLSNPGPKGDQESSYNLKAPYSGSGTVSLQTLAS